MNPEDLGNGIRERTPIRGKVVSGILLFRPSIWLVGTHGFQVGSRGSGVREGLGARVRLCGTGPALAGKLGQGDAFALRARGLGDRFQSSLRPDPAAVSGSGNGVREGTPVLDPGNPRRCRPSARTAPPLRRSSVHCLVGQGSGLTAVSKPNHRWNAI
jgi:hypothetical protein